MALTEGYDLNLQGQDLIVRPGTYRKRVAPTFGARFATGDPSWRDLSFWQHHAQADWIGGCGAEQWSDPAMFDKAVGVDTTKKGVTSIGRGVEGNVTLSGKVAGYPVNLIETPYGLFAWQGSGTTASCDARIWKYTDQGVGVYNSSSWSRKDNTYTRQIGSLGQSPFRPTSAVYVGGGKIWFFGTHNSSPASGYSGVWAFDVTSYSWTAVTNLSLIANAAYACASVFGAYVYVWAGNALNCYTVTTSTSATARVGWTPPTWPGVDLVAAADLDGGYLWALSTNGRIGRCDGNTFTEYYRFDRGVQGVAMRSFDGKLLLTTFEWVDSATVGEGVVYQMSGAAITQLKRWGPVDKATVLSSIVTHGRKAYYSAGGLFGWEAGVGIACYDPVEDAHSLYVTTRDAAYADTSGTGLDVIVDGIAFYGGYMYFAVRGFGIMRTPVKTGGTVVYDFSTTVAYTDIASKTGGWVESSDFDAGTPGMSKTWRYILVDAYLANGTGIYVEYSLDSGETWSYAGLVRRGDVGVQYIGADGALSRRGILVFPLPELQISPRFKYRVTYWSSGSNTPKVYSVVASYLPMPDPNWQWEFYTVISEKQELSDGRVVTRVPSTVKANIENNIRLSGGLLTFTDYDGSEYLVYVSDFFEDHPTMRSPDEVGMRFVLIEGNPG